MTGNMMMDLPQLELGGSRETAPGSERGLLMILMIPSSTTTAIMEMKKNTPAPISMMALLQTVLVKPVHGTIRMDMKQSAPT